MVVNKLSPEVNVGVGAGVGVLTAIKKSSHNNLKAFENEWQDNGLWEWQESLKGLGFFS